MSQVQPRRTRLSSASALILLGIVVIVLAITIPGILSSERASNERLASTMLKSLTSAEADFRANDLDGNHVKDFWTGDVAGLYRFKSSGEGKPLIDRALAEADAFPLQPLCPQPRPVHGYYFVAMDTDDAEMDPKAKAYRQDTGGSPAMGAVHHLSKFGFSAYPADYGVTGRYSFMVDENNTVFRFDNKGKPFLHSPTAQQLQALIDAAGH